MLETELYLPVKRFLEAQGYAVKAEIGGCDVLAVRGDEPPVIVELKTSFNLQLLLQGIDRQSVTDTVYLAIPEPKRALPQDILRLCKRLGLGSAGGEWPMGRGLPRSRPLPAAQGPAPQNPAPAGVSAPGGRSQFRRQQQAPPGHRLPAGCLALREISQDHRRLKGLRHRRANQGRARRVNPQARCLWLVRRRKRAASISSRPKAKRRSPPSAMSWRLSELPDGISGCAV